MGEAMSRPIITWASDWDAVRTVGHSHRSTTSSRTPGHKNEGTVAYALNKIVTCPACGHLRYAGTGPHAPRWLDGRLVDCCGREVRP
jgi:hypothetical protein